MGKVTTGWMTIEAEQFLLQQIATHQFYGQPN